MTSHGFVVAQFKPDKSGYWLPRSARLAAAKIPCPPFWAIRFNLYDSEDDDDYANTPGLLCAVSPFPSSIPIPDASFTLGPTFAIDTKEYSNHTGPDGAQLTAIPAVNCLAKNLQQPLYLHTVPTLPIAGAHKIPLEVYYHVLDHSSFLLFRKAVLANRDPLLFAWIERRKVAVAERLPQRVRELESDQRDWPLFGDNENPDPTYMFGELNNPHTYCFDFINSGPIPPCHHPSYIYSQLFIYFQVCKDYRWNGVEETIKYVRAVRADIHDNHRIVQPSGYDDYDIDAPASGHARRLLQQDSAFRTQLAAFSTIAALAYTRLTPVSESWSSLNREIISSTGKSRNSGLDRSGRSNHRGSRHGGGGSHGEGDGEAGPDEGDRSLRAAGPEGDNTPALFLRFLPFAYPRLPWQFPRVPMPSSPQAVVLDVFGVILDREGAIRDALEPYLPLARLRLSGVSEAVKLYIELEALAARSQCVSATSLPVIVHIALDAFASKLGLAPASRTTFLADAAARILHPRPYDDATQAIKQLMWQGYTPVGLSPFSPNTLDTVRPALLPNMQFFPMAIPLHASVPATFCTQLRLWCQQVIARGNRARSFSAADVLIVSGGMGRVLAPAAAAAHPTVLVRRPEGVECNVNFVVGTGDRTPHPSAVVRGLTELCGALRT